MSALTFSRTNVADFSSFYCLSEIKLSRELTFCVTGAITSRQFGLVHFDAVLFSSRDVNDPLECTCSEESFCHAVQFSSCDVNAA